jgi:hypothetical protein
MGKYVVAWPVGVPAIHQRRPLSFGGDAAMASPIQSSMNECRKRGAAQLLRNRMKCMRRRSSK